MKIEKLHKHINIGTLVQIGEGQVLFFVEWISTDRTQFKVLNGDTVYSASVVEHYTNQYTITNYNIFNTHWRNWSIETFELEYFGNAAYILVLYRNLNRRYSKLFKSLEEMEEFIDSKKGGNELGTIDNIVDYFNNDN